MVSSPRAPWEVLPNCRSWASLRGLPALALLGGLLGGLLGVLALLSRAILDERPRSVTPRGLSHGAWVRGKALVPAQQPCACATWPRRGRVLNVTQCCAVLRSRRKKTSAHGRN